LAKKRGLYGLKFEVEKPVSPIQSLVKPLIWQDENVAPKPPSPKVQELAPKVKRSPLQQKAIMQKSPPPSSSSSAISPKTDSNDEDIVYMPIRGRLSNWKQLTCR
jgi:hypothetical protein